MNFSLYVFLGKPFVKKKAFEMFSLCNLAHFPTQVVEGKKQKVGPNFP